MKETMFTITVVSSEDISSFDLQGHSRDLDGLLK